MLYAKGKCHYHYQKARGYFSTPEFLEKQRLRVQRWKSIPGNKERMKETSRLYRLRKKEALNKSSQTV